MVSASNCTDTPITVVGAGGNCVDSTIYPTVQPSGDLPSFVVPSDELFVTDADGKVFYNGTLPMVSVASGECIGDYTDPASCTKWVDITTLLQIGTND